METMGAAISTAYIWQTQRLGSVSILYSYCHVFLLSHNSDLACSFKKTEVGLFYRHWLWQET